MLDPSPAPLHASAATDDAWESTPSGALAAMARPLSAVHGTSLVTTSMIAVAFGLAHAEGPNTATAIVQAAIAADAARARFDGAPAIHRRYRVL